MRALPKRGKWKCLMTMPPIFVSDKFPEITRRLLELLRSLTASEWSLPTVSSRRTVKDVASHLLDGSLRRLSMQRDGFRSADGRSQPRPDEPLVEFLNRLNDEWETSARRLSPKVLIDLIEWADAQLAQLFHSLDPHGLAIFPVAWAGEVRSDNWMDVAREFTEKWHHTQQILTPRADPAPSSTKNSANRAWTSSCGRCLLPFVTSKLMSAALWSWKFKAMPEGNGTLRNSGKDGNRPFNPRSRRQPRSPWTRTRHGRCLRNGVAETRSASSFQTSAS